MSIYDELQSVVTEVMTEFKQGVVQYIHVTPSGGSVDDPGDPTETAYNIKSAVRGASFRFVQSGLALASDLQVTFDVVVENTNSGVKTNLSTIAPTKDDVMRGFVNIDGVRYKVVGFDPVPAAGSPVAYTLIVRK